MPETQAAPQPDLTAMMAMMAQMMQQMQSQQAQIQEMARQQAQAQVDAINRADQAKSAAAEEAARVASHKQSVWLEIAHVAVAAAPVFLAGASIYYGRSMQNSKAAQYVQLGTTLANSLFPAQQVQP